MTKEEILKSLGRPKTNDEDLIKYIHEAMELYAANESAKAISYQASVIESLQREVSKMEEICKRHKEDKETLRELLVRAKEYLELTVHPVKPFPSFKLIEGLLSAIDDQLKK